MAPIDPTRNIMVKVQVFTWNLGHIWKPMNFAVSTELHIYNAVKFLIDLTLLDPRIYNFVVMGKENVELGLVD